MVTKYLIEEKYRGLIRYIRYRASDISTIARYSDFTMATVRKILIRFEEQGLINAVFNNPALHKRNYIIEFTPKAYKILGLIDEIRRILENDNR